MALNKRLIEELQAEAGDLGVALALPEYIDRIDPQSQNHVVFNASEELVRIRHQRGEQL